MVVSYLIHKYRIRFLYCSGSGAVGDRGTVLLSALWSMRDRGRSLSRSAFEVVVYDGSLVEALPVSGSLSPLYFS